MKSASNVRADVTDDGILLLDIDKGAIYSANGVGGRIWQLLQDGHTEQAIVDRIVAEYGAPRSSVEADVPQFIATLRDKALVKD